MPIAHLYHCTHNVITCLSQLIFYFFPLINIRTGITKFVNVEKSKRCHLIFIGKDAINTGWRNKLYTGYGTWAKLTAAAYFSLSGINLIASPSIFWPGKFCKLEKDVLATFGKCSLLTDREKQSFVLLPRWATLVVDVPSHQSWTSCPSRPIWPGKTCWFLKAICLIHRL